jgi:hypothetical protein
MIDEDQNKNRMVRAGKTDIILTIKAILYCQANMAKKAPIIWYKGAPGLTYF